MKLKLGHHLIFEGAELTGKSYLMRGVYDYLEPKYNQNRVLLDGCHWFNSDVGIFGTKNGRFCIERYVEMLEQLKEKNVMFEKLFLSDIVYNKIHFNKYIDYSDIIKKLKKLKTKIVLCVIDEDKKIIRKRIKDRLRLYPHYERILHNPEWYIKQQREYLLQLKRIDLDYLIIDMTKIPNKKHLEVLRWIGEID